MLKLLVKLVYTAAMFIEAIVLTRIVLDLINANMNNVFASWIKNVSEIFISPFKGLVASTLQIDNFTVSLTPIVALVFYIIAAFILSELLKAFSKE